jgi:hypothetical protein
VIGKEVPGRQSADGSFATRAPSFPTRTRGADALALVTLEACLATLDVSSLLLGER